MRNRQKFWRMPHATSRGSRRSTHSYHPQWRQKISPIFWKPVRALICGWGPMAQRRARHYITRITILMTNLSHLASVFGYRWWRGHWVLFLLLLRINYEPYPLYWCWSNDRSDSARRLKTRRIKPARGQLIGY